MRLAEQTKIVPLIDPADYNSAGKDGDSFTMKNYAHATIVVVFGALTGNSVLKVYEGATAGTKTTAKTFNYRLGSAAIGTAIADTLAAETSSAALTLTAATYNNKVLVIELDDSELTDGTPWVTVEIDATATALFVSAMAILSKPRYAQNVPPTAIT